MMIGGVSLVLPGLFGGQLSGRVVTTLPSICLEKTRQSVAIHPPPDNTGTVTGVIHLILHRYQRKLRYRCGAFTAR